VIIGLDSGFDDAQAVVLMKNYSGKQNRWVKMTIQSFFKK